MKFSKKTIDFLFLFEMFTRNRIFSLLLVWGAPKKEEDGLRTGDQLLKQPALVLVKY